MKHNSQFDEQNKKFWNEICGTTFAEMNNIELQDLNQIHAFDKLYFEFYPYLFDELNWVLEGAESCFEVGLGAGTVSRYLASHCSDYLGIDISDQSCNFVQSTLIHLQLEGKTSCGSILNKIQPGNLKKYDSAVAIGSLHHTGDLDLALKNLESVVKPGGRILVMVYNYSQPKRILYNPLLYISNFLHVLTKSKFHFKEQSRFIRKSSDSNTAGDPAPITTYSSKSLFLNRKEFNYICSLKNSHKLGYKFIYIPRKFVLKYFSPFIGTDIYARGIRLGKLSKDTSN